MVSHWFRRDIARIGTSGTTVREDLAFFADVVKDDPSVEYRPAMPLANPTRGIAILESLQDLGQPDLVE